MRRPKAIEKIMMVIRQVAPQAQVIVYGSEARGDARADSDFDILILEDTDKITYERLQEITGPLYDLSWQEDIEVSPMVLTRHQWESRPFKTPFYCNVMNEGIVL